MTVGAVSILFVMMSLALAACATPGPAGARPQANPTSAAPTSDAGSPAAAAAGDRLLVSDGGENNAPELAIVDTAKNSAERTAPFGFLSPDRATVYVEDRDTTKTTIRAVDFATGAQLRQTSLDGHYGVPAAAALEEPSPFSRDGRWLVLEYLPTEAEVDAWRYSDRPRTRFVVLDTSFNGQMRSVDLDGMFWFDALSGDGAWLYLLEIQDKGFPQSYGSDRAPNYQVRAYDLSNGALAPEPVVDKREVEQMNGFRSSSALAFDGTWLYSVYTRPNDGPFIHALDLADRVAVCIDLPFETADWETNLLWSVVQAPGSNLLYAVNGATGQVAEVDTTNYQVRRSAVLPRARAAVPDLLARLGDWLAPRAEAKRMVVGGARLSPDGKTLFAIADKGLLVVNTGDLTLRGRYLADSMLSSLALSLDGARLYAVETPGAGANKLLRVDAATGALLGEVKGLNGPQSILSVEPAR